MALLDGKKLVTGCVTTGGTLSVAGLLATRYVAAKFGAEDVPILCGGSAATLAAAVFGGRALVKQAGPRLSGLPDIAAEKINPLIDQLITGRNSVYADGEQVMPDWVDFVTEFRPRAPILPVGWDDEKLRIVECNMGQNYGWAVSGTTGEGKSRYLLRPAIAAALMSGWQVIMADPELHSFRAIADSEHPNAYLMNTNEDTLLKFARSIYHEHVRRNEILARYKVSMIDGIRADRRPPRVLIVVDEYSNMLDTIRDKNKEGNKIANSVQLAFGRVAKAGRKTGLHLILVAQRPTDPQLNKTLKSQLIPMVFYMQDEADYKNLCRIKTPDPELEQGTFIAGIRRNHSRVRGWHPTDEMIQEALSLSQARAYPKPEWVYGFNQRYIPSPDQDVSENAPDDDAVADLPPEEQDSHDASANQEAMPATMAARPMMASATIAASPNNRAANEANAVNQPTSSDSEGASTLAEYAQVIQALVSADPNPSSIPTVSGGQFRAIVYWAMTYDMSNVAGQKPEVSKNAMYPLVFGTAKNNRLASKVQQVLTLWSTFAGGINANSNRQDSGVVEAPRTSAPALQPA